MEGCRRVIDRFLLSLSRSPMKEACAEFLGTFFLILCGDGVMAAITLGRLDHAATLVSAFGWGLAILIGICIAGGISGGHLNPAVTVAMACMRKCPWKCVFPYILSQYLASFIAAALVYTVYYDAINEFDNGIRQMPPDVNSTAQIFSTYPQAYVSIGACFIDQVVGTALLLIVICAATDKRSTNLPHIQSAVIGLGLAAICLAFGQNCGAPLNPARDLGPRIFTALAGWGLKTFSVRNWRWFWIPVIGPHVGAVLGVWLYHFFIEMHYRNYELLFNGRELERTEEQLPTVCITKPSSVSSNERMLSSDGTEVFKISYKNSEKETSNEVPQKEEAPQKTSEDPASLLL
ncbi:aquaporin-10 [Trichonephila inaurata madagascariensis]|uniref:Aquaporin-10 n=1 Tax=Trichonephila inaurata madagascariensis TaxID=2747483 RepID=A0A8X7C508_9ARAC|nr:aquaporin-10 [Trichonephila inaurata madagascariensis]